MKISTRDSSQKTVNVNGSGEILRITHTPHFFIVEWQYRTSTGYSASTGTLRITKLDGTTVDISIPFLTTVGAADGRSVMIPLACRRVQVISEPTQL